MVIALEYIPGHEEEYIPGHEEKGIDITYCLKLMPEILVLY
jgi:hypothetical protein